MPNQDQGMWGNIGQSLQQGAQRSGWMDNNENFNWDRFGVTTGQIAQAMDPNTAMGRLGAVGAGLGKSSIAAKSAEEEKNKQALWWKAVMDGLAGSKPTDKTQPGINEYKVGPDGTVTITGQMGGMEEKAEAPKPPDQSSGNALSNFQDSPASTGVNLAGLSPQEINAIMNQRTASNKLNMEQALAYHGMANPKGQIVAGEEGYWNVNPYDGSATRIEGPVPYRKPAGGGGSPHYEDLYSPDGTKKSFIYGTQQHAEAVNKGWTRSDPGDVPERERFDEDVRARYLRTVNTVKSDPKSETSKLAIPFLNEQTPENAHEFWVWKEPSFFKHGAWEGARKKTLPTIKDKQLTVGYVRRVQQKFGLSSIEEAVNYIEEKNR